jgi:hypothetical protein
VSGSSVSELVGGGCGDVGGGDGCGGGDVDNVSAGYEALDNGRRVIKNIRHHKVITIFFIFFTPLFFIWCK